ncbi:unnamed protein product [Mytilus coruscus]|uniref:Uncharacterized protein n=1 Tax=Mytilus coruscus TaxID=42192 RepID=A0A6J8DWT6_MYTCO|nr:unnamed protein product [Mytilus coruscus]
MRYLPVIQIYKAVDNQTRAIILKKPIDKDFANLIATIEWPNRNELLKKNISKKFENIMTPASNSCSEKDRHILKYIISTLTSVEFLNKTGIDGKRYQRSSLNTSMTYAKETIQKRTVNKDSSSANMLHKKRTETGQRIQVLGSGRKLLAERYPDLTTLMLRLFDAGGDGLQIHPRLICDTLFLHKSKWMNMPRCVTILKEIYDIDISISAAYTYTENYREKSHQAQRHHHGKNVNPGISLKKPTRDGNHNPSINDHFAQTDINYSIEETLINNGKVIARDGKALVHCDVEIVQRPSKSWKKVIYSDHDWEKDTKRSLQITTYQFVKVKDMSENEDIVAQFSGIPICQSRLTGGGLSIVKIHYFENSTVFRHFNEFLFVMTLENQHAFFHIGDNGLIPQLLITVDGGPDERPRNKQTMFATVLLRKLLNMDKVKVISYAEGCSKRHSVERLHFDEGRSLSQSGVISSKSINENETEEGLFSQEKFKENMEAAREEAVNRIDETPYASEKIEAVKPPPDFDWILTPETISKIISFLKKDTSEHRFENNFTIKPEGPVWNKLCKMYGICPTKCFNAVSVYNEV